MAITVTSVSERRDARADQTREGFEFVRYFIVRLSGVTSSNLPEAIDTSMRATGIPAYDALWPYTVTDRVTPRVYRKTAQLKEEERKDVFLVEVHYNNSAAVIDQSNTGRGSETAEVAPWLQDELYDYDFVEREVALETDKAGAAIRNAAGDAFDPPVTVPKASLVITITRATQGASAYSPSAAGPLHNTLNTSAFGIDGVTYAAKTLRLRKWSGSDAVWVDPSTGTRTAYTNETIIIEYRPEGWNASLINQGYRYLSAAGGTPIRSTSSTPVLLNADGTLNTTTTPTTLTFELYDETAWTALGSL